ncbi:MAG: hypothetical protein KTR26_18135 [Flammeovirgaceae bacterium]|nr:hypothetical protein [Flammeovirgaceae bacterium]
MNKKASIKYNDELIFEQDYTESLDEIRAVLFQFSGTGGAVKNIAIANHNN